MTTFQIVLVSVFGALFFASLVGSARRLRVSKERYGWSILWGIGMILAVKPDITTDAANVLGIGRGADLVFYCGIVVMLVGFLMVYARMRRLRRDVTLLVRHIAVLEAELGTQNKERA